MDSLALATGARRAEATAEPARPPVAHRPAALDVDEHAPAVYLLRVALLVRDLHVALVLILDEAVAARLACGRVLDDLDRLDRAELLKLLAQRRLRCRVVHACYENGLVRVRRLAFYNGRRVVRGDERLESRLGRSGLSLAPPGAPLLDSFDGLRRRCLRRVLKLVDMLRKARVRRHLALLERRLVVDWDARRKERKDGGRQRMRDSR